MEFRVLGTVSVVSERGEPLPLGPAKRRSLLAMLLLRPNTEVAVDRLTEALWDEEPPRHSRTVVQGHVSRLRTLLDEHRAAAHGVELATRSGAYVLRLPDPGTLVDARRFEELLRLARTRHEPGEAVALLREALGLWQGPAFAGTVGSRALEAAAHELEELRLVAVEELAGAHGRLGEHGTAAAVLRAEAVAHPLREPLIAALMLALGRAGRQSEALDWFHRTRLLLADQLGVDPGAVLTDAYTALLRADLPQDDAPTAAAVPTAPTTVPALDVPQLLPRRPGGFTGRQPELAALDRATAGAPGPIALITGSAGVGKTALALHWAHQHGADFPGGRLFADLRGYSSTPARDTTLVLRGFLLALGVPAEAMPETPEAMGARYRALTAGRRMLVVLDNARASEHIRPLLPGGEDCVTIVTSRDRLGGLVASDAARPVPLAELPAAQSTALLAAVLGEDVVAAEPEAAVHLAGLCDGLPLALRAAAARLATRPHAGGLAALAGELADEQARLDLLNVEGAGVATALGLTVQHLPGPARRLFQQLGLHTGPTLDTCTAATLADCPPGRAATALDQLAATHLVIESGPRSYAVHDLVRLYARSLASEPDPDGLLRLLDH